MLSGGEQGARLQIAGQVFAHRPGDGEVIEGIRGAADLIRYTKLLPWRAEGCWRFRPFPP